MRIFSRSSKADRMSRVADAEPTGPPTDSHKAHGSGAVIHQGCGTRLPLEYAASSAVRSLKPLGLAVAMAITLCGCAEHARNVLIPLDVEVPNASRVDMLVMTTRAPSSQPGQLFTGERGAGRALDEIVVSVPPNANRKVGDVQWPAALPADPAHDFATVKVVDMARSQADPWFRRVGSNGHKLLIFVHGFNTTKEEAVYRFAQIVHDAGTRAAPVLFTWPSRGDLLQYAYDKESATASRDALEALLSYAATDPNVSDVTVLAHSLGNWVAMEALRQMAIRHGGNQPEDQERHPRLG